MILSKKVLTSYDNNHKKKSRTERNGSERGATQGSLVEQSAL